MITDRQTNTVYFSNLLPEAYPHEFQSLIDILIDHGIKVKLLRATHDFYGRDYMPLQVGDNDFVQFIFRPKAYFDSEWYEEITNPVEVELTNTIKQPRYSSLVLDGGNVIKWTDKVIITRRVITDNRYQFSTDEELIQRLEFDLRCKVLLIDEYPNEITGHADGLVRFIDANTVFINKPLAENAQWEQKFRKQLKADGLNFIELPNPMSPQMETAEGLYLSYLQVGQIVVCPQFGISEDQLAFDLIKKAFPQDKVIPFKANWLAESGGVFNCASWSVKA